mmetsp:Transcript_45584/g.130037  ORF Transcript_45584/g.130037 Transcript_45584/m.130037 type:complete len:517 (+) Transcript_45584:51-1601(+)
MSVAIISGLAFACCVFLPDAHRPADDAGALLKLKTSVEGAGKTAVLGLDGSTKSGAQASGQVRSCEPQDGDAWGWEEMHLTNYFECIEDLGERGDGHAFRVSPLARKQLPQEQLPQVSLSSLEPSVTYVVKGFACRYVFPDQPMALTHLQKADSRAGRRQLREMRKEDPKLPTVQSQRQHARDECGNAQEIHKVLLRGSTYLAKCLYEHVPVDNTIARFPDANMVDFLVMEDAGAMPEEAAGDEEGLDWPTFVAKRAKEGKITQIANVFTDILQQSLRALIDLRDASWVHRDLGSENVVLKIWRTEDDWVPVLKVTGFGEAREFKDIATKAKRRHPCAPPEVFASTDPFDPDMPESFDMYLMGCLLVELLVGSSWSEIAPTALVTAEEKSVVYETPLDEMWDGNPDFLQSVQDFDAETADDEDKMYIRWDFTKLSCEAGGGPLNKTHFQYLVTQWRRTNKNQRKCTVWGRLNRNNPNLLESVLTIILQMLAYVPAKRGNLAELMDQAHQIKQAEQN